MAAYRNQVSVAGVGFDIACGNAAVRTDLGLDDLRQRTGGLRRNLERIGDEVRAGLSFGVGGTNRSPDAPSNHPLFDDPAWAAVPATHRSALLAKARRQLGSVGSGNHYVDVFADERDRVWVGVHFGSRGFGHTVASSFLAIGQGAEWGTRVREAEIIFDLDAPAGHDYWHLMKLAGRYAYAGREWAVRKAVEIVGGREIELVHNHHNFAWEEEHFGRTFVVVRKGAHAGVSRTEGVRGRIDGRRRGDSGGDAGGGAGVADGRTAGARAVFDRARRRPRDEPHGRAGEASPPLGQGAQAREGVARDDDGLGGRAGRGAEGWGGWTKARTCTGGSRTCWPRRATR